MLNRNFLKHGLEILHIHSANGPTSVCGCIFFCIQSLYFEVKNNMNCSFLEYSNQVNKDIFFPFIKFTHTYTDVCRYVLKMCQYILKINMPFIQHLKKMKMRILPLGIKKTNPKQSKKDKTVSKTRF